MTRQTRIARLTCTGSNGCREGSNGPHTRGVQVTETFEARLSFSTYTGDQWDLTRSTPVFLRRGRDGQLHNPHVFCQAQSIVLSSRKHYED